MAAAPRHARHSLRESRSSAARAAGEGEATIGVDTRREPRGDATARHARHAPASSSAVRRSRTSLGLAAVLGAGTPLAAAASAMASPAPATAATTSPAQTSTPTPTVTVRAGDTLAAIAHRTGSTVTALTAANHLANPNRLYVGQVLTIGQSTPSPPAPVPARPTASGAPSSATPAVLTVSRQGTWTVRSGDTLGTIATRTGSSVAALVSVNHLANPNRLSVGQVLAVPSGAAGNGAVTSVATPSSSTARPVVAQTPPATPAGAPPAASLPTTSTSTASTPSVSSTFAGRTYASSTTTAANADAAALAATPVPTKAQMQAMVAATARSMGVDPALAQAIAYQESGFNMRAVSPADAIGVMQVIPSSGAWASSMVGRTLDLRDPQDNVTAGVAILRSLVKAAPDTPTAIGGYYQGLAGVLAKGMYADTKAYVASVTSLMARFSVPASQ